MAIPWVAVGTLVVTLSAGTDAPPMTRSRMAAVDAAWLHMDRPVNELVVNAVLWFDEPLDAETVREAVENRLVAKHPRFAQRVEDDGTVAWWVTVADFDP